ncbi:UrcA family protein [Peristeroidobacter soli]|uniref:UrcA family protein n=1 Tax=Peristeroidobacter soli TaxID=2497877 RepID=UPI00101C3A27|nr:UrcA family protein [Peristeroidobacter soli]
MCKLNAAPERSHILLLTVIAACLVSGFASADNGGTGDVPKIVVSLAGIETSTPKGAELAYDRIRSAAKIVCRVDQSRELERMVRARACYQSALSDAVGQANRPLLSALHAQRTGERNEMIRTAARR